MPDLELPFWAGEPGVLADRVERVTTGLRSSTGGLAAFAPRNVQGLVNREAVTPPPAAGVLWPLEIKTTV